MEKMYPQLTRLLKAGFSVELSPKTDGETVTLTVQEAKNGIVDGVNIDLCGMEWLFAEEGIGDRLKEAADTLLSNAGGQSE